MFIWCKYRVNRNKHKHLEWKVHFIALQYTKVKITYLKPGSTTLLTGVKIWLRRKRDLFSGKDTMLLCIRIFSSAYSFNFG